MLAPNAWPYPQPASGGSGEPRPGLYQPLLRARCATLHPMSPLIPMVVEQEAIALKRRIEEIIAQHTGQPLDTVAKDMERDYFMTAEEAKQYASSTR